VYGNGDNVIIHKINLT